MAKAKRTYKLPIEELGMRFGTEYCGAISAPVTSLLRLQVRECFGKTGQPARKPRLKGRAAKVQRYLKAQKPTELANLVG